MTDDPWDLDPDLPDDLRKTPMMIHHPRCNPGCIGDSHYMDNRTEAMPVKRPLRMDIDRLAAALAIVMCDLDKTPGPSGSFVLGEGTSYWRDRAEAVAEHYAAGRTFADLPNDE